MKKGVHPKVNPVIFIDEETGEEIFSKSTMTSDEKRRVDGVEYQVVRLDVTSFSHPFFTGEMRFVDRQGRVDKFQKRVKAATKSKSKKKQVAQQETKHQSYQEILLAKQSDLRQTKNSQAQSK